MKILAKSKQAPDFAPRAIMELRVPEARHAWEMYTSGFIREMYMTPDGRGAMLILEAESLEAAQEALDELPLVRANQIAFDLTAMMPFTPFAALFE